MDLMHTGSIDTFCLVSSDSDFTRLAQRLREHHKTVIGFGERHTPRAFIMSCHRFIYYDNLIGTTTREGGEGENDGGERGAAEASGGGGDNNNDDPTVVPWQEPTSQQAIELICKAMSDYEDADGWSTLSPIGQRLPAIAPDFDPRNYGCRKLIELVRKTMAFDIRPPDHAHNNEWRIRLRTTTTTTTTTTTS
jgi:hypothetical protein